MLSGVPAEDLAVRQGFVRSRVPRRAVMLHRYLSD
jgi:hypothetical protein